MPARPSDDQFAAAYGAFEEYVAAKQRFVEAMHAVGVQTGNVDPFANFAEVIVAKEMRGSIQRATNKGFDVLTPDGKKVQVKSLRVSSQKPADNGVDWLCCTRIAPRHDSPLIDADLLAIVLYLDGRPYALVVFPIELRSMFPVANVKGLFFSHVRQLVEGKRGLEGSGVQVVSLQQRSWQ